MSTPAAKGKAKGGSGVTTPPRRHRRILLADGGASAHFFLLGEFANTPDAAGRSIEQFARVISADHSKFGEVELNQAAFDSFIKNFNENVYGQEIYVNRHHDDSQGVLGKVERLFSEGGKLFAQILWTDKGVKVFKEDGFKYFSIEFVDNYENPETKKHFGPTLLGAALTPRPFIKNMQPTAGPGRVALSEGRRIYVPTYLQLTEGASMWKKFAEALRKKLGEFKLSETVVGAILASFEEKAKQLADDEPKLTALRIECEADAAKLHEFFNGTRSAGEDDAKFQLTDAKLADAIGKVLKARDDDTKKTQETLSGNRKAFSERINAAKGLSDGTKQFLLKSQDVITAEMNADQVTRLADRTVEMGNEMEVTRQRSAIGLNVGAIGTVQLTDQTLSGVHNFMREKLMLTDSFGMKNLKLAEEKDLSGFAKKVLAQFDRIHGPRLEAEYKRLSGDGSTVISDGEFPVVAQRQVILELLADLKFMSIVQALTDPTAQATTQIPFETRNVSNVTNGGIVYEGGAIHYAGVSQDMDTAFIVPRKIALLMSNEMIHFSRVALINWDAWGRNIASNARLMRDLICAAIANQLQRTADSYLASSVVDEAITGQVNGTRTVFKTASWPVVRPYQPRDLQGTAVGAAENPVTVKIATVAKAEYDGTGNQAAGNYWQLTDPNMGYFRIVNELGVVQTLVSATVVTISYDYATNVQKFDLDNGAVEMSLYLNGLLNAFGDRKAALKQQRFVQPNFGISSDALHNTMTKARAFEANSVKPGTGLASDGDLEAIKSVPMFGTNQPGVDLGDSRIILGERGTLSYVIAKPFATGTPFEAVNSQGKPIGKKVAYGEEYSSIHVPRPIRGRLTSVIAFSTIARAAV